MGNCMGNSSSSITSARAPSVARQGARPAADKFTYIADNFNTLDQVQAALRSNGLESSSLIIAVDFTKSNEWTGKKSFRGQSLHSLGSQPNPYEMAISIISRTLQSFDDDGLIPAIGFGDATTGDAAVFNFFNGGEPAKGLDALSYRYRELVPHIKLAGPTSFAPAIYQAMKIVSETGGQYHILVLVADGQVTRPTDTPANFTSKQEKETIDAIVAASELPLSIVMVGVGDGPWDVMEEFDDKIPDRRWDNFQFVNFTEIIVSHGSNPQRMEAVFALRALMEIPDQYKLIQKLGLLGRSMARPPNVRCLEPPGPRPSYPGGFGAAGPPAPAQVYGSPVYSPPGQAPQGYAGGPGQMTLQGYAPGPGQMAPQFGQMPAYGSQHAPPTYAGYPPPAGSSSGGGGPSFEPFGGASRKGEPDRPPNPWPAAERGSMVGGSQRMSAAAVAVQNADSLFVCPITQELMEDPVIAADGYTYDRTSVTKWFESHNTSPMTNAVLPHRNLTPNHALRSSIMEYKEAQARLPP